MSKQILELAFQALTDTQALWVLGDAVLEQQWYDARLMRYNYHLTANDDHTMEQTHAEVAAQPNSRWARAIVCVLGFGSHWEEEIWPVASRCHDGRWVSHSAMNSLYGGENDRQISAHRNRSGLLYPSAKPRTETYILPFPAVEIHPGQSGTVRTQPQTTIRGNRLIIPSNVCDSITIHMIRVANQEYNIGSGSIPGRVFSEEAVPMELKLPTMSPANTMQLSMMNVGRRVVTVRAVLYGVGVNYD